jgi:hypothetical protein
MAVHDSANYTHQRLKEKTNLESCTRQIAMSHVDFGVSVDFFVVNRATGILSIGSPRTVSAMQYLSLCLEVLTVH